MNEIKINTLNLKKNIFRVMNLEGLNANKSMLKGYIEECDKKKQYYSKLLSIVDEEIKRRMEL